MRYYLVNGRVAGVQRGGQTLHAETADGAAMRYALDAIARDGDIGGAIATVDVCELWTLNPSAPDAAWRRGEESRWRLSVVVTAEREGGPDA